MCFMGVWKVLDGFCSHPDDGVCEYEACFLLTAVLAILKSFSQILMSMRVLFSWEDHQRMTVA